jgi:hypothetical protein
LLLKRCCNAKVNNFYKSRTGQQIQLFEQALGQFDQRLMTGTCNVWGYNHILSPQQLLQQGGFMGGIACKILIFKHIQTCSRYQVIV